MIFILGQVYNHLHYRQLAETNAARMSTNGHRLPLEPFVLRMICRSKGMWGSEVIDTISLEKFSFGTGTMILPCGHSMMEESVNALFAGASDVELKPCPMCRLPGTCARVRVWRRAARRALGDASVG